MKNDGKDFNSSEDPEFQDFLELLKESMLRDEDVDDAELLEDDEYPNLEDELGLNDVPDTECPMMSHISEVLKETVGNLGGFLGLKWEDEEMIAILKLLNYKKSTYKIHLDLPEDLSNDEMEVMKMIVPEGELEVDIVKKPREKITEENFKDHMPKVVFEKEMKNLVKNFIIGLISKEDSSDGSDSN